MGKNFKNLTYNTFLVILGVPKNIFIFQIQFGNCHVTFRIKDSLSEAAPKSDAQPQMALFSTMEETY